MRDAGLQPDQIDYINAHGTSTELGDKLETMAIKRAFGDMHGKVAVSSTKTMTGHLLGGAGGLEAGITVLAIRDRLLRRRSTTTSPIRSAIWTMCRNQARARRRSEYALSNSFGFGGTNGSLIFRRFRG